MRRSFPTVFILALGWLLGRLEAGPAPVLASGPSDFAAAAEAAGPSIVHVSTQLPGHSRDDAVGSGFVLSPDGLIVASRHVLAGAQKVFVGVAGQPPVRAEVLGYDERVDVALLQVPLTGLRPLAIGSTQGLKPGHWVLACGSPYGLERSWSAGIVSGLHRRGVATNPSTYEDFIQTDAAANLGNSGGPLLDTSGRALGMVTQILTRAGGFQGISLATPIEAVMEAVGRLRQRLGGATAHRPSLGILVRDMLPWGVEITQVPAGSPAAVAGMRAGQRLHSVSGTPVKSTADVERALWGRQAGERIQVEVATTLRNPDGTRAGGSIGAYVIELR